MVHARGWREGLATLDNAIWAAAPGRYDIGVRGDCETGEAGDEWTFGSEWNDNVARHVAYLVAADMPGLAGSSLNQRVCVLFYDDYDRNAVDIALDGGTMHVVLAQGIEPSSFAQTWNAIRYRASLSARSPRRPVVEIRFPAIEVASPADGRGGPVCMSVFHACGSAYDGDGDIARNAGRIGRYEVSFSDRFCMFAYLPPSPAYNAYADFAHEDGIKPFIALSVRDIGDFQPLAERLCDYDQFWGREMPS